MNSEFVSSTTDIARLPHNDRPHIALVGRSNVGKSSLINALTKRTDLARVSSGPGRTQTMNLYAIDGRYYLMDLPGYGYAKTSKEQRAVFADMLNVYLAEVQQIALVLVVLDARLGPTADDQEMIDYLYTLGIPFLILANKIDKLKPQERKDLLRSLQEYYPDTRIIPHSSLAKENRDLLLRTIEDAVRGT